MRRLYFLIISILFMTGSGISAPYFQLDDPILKLAANSGVDVVWDGTYLWVGTSKGISGTDNDGASWITYDSTNGLPSNEVSAMATDGNHLWVGSSGSIISQGQSVPIGKGISLTTNFGSTFQTFTPFQATSPGMLAYDLDAIDTVVYAACFYGGLIYSKDEGQTWTNLFPDTLAETDFNDSLFDYYNDRFFSVKVDNNYDDTTVVWGGTAAGINQFQFIARPVKLAGNGINDFAAQGKYVWVATNLGLSISENDGLSFRSYFQSDGLTSDYTSAVAAVDGYVICAGYDDALDQGTGFAFSTDSGMTWEQSVPAQAVGSGKKVSDIEITTYGNSDLIIWAACSDGGLIRSLDSAQTWEQVVLDQAETSPDSAFNKIFSLKAEYPFPYTSPCADTDTLLMLAGSGDGLWSFKVPCPYNGAIQSAKLHRLDDIELAGRKVSAVDANYWVTATDDTIFEWALATQPFDGQGAIAVLLSQDYGTTWTPTLATVKSTDLMYTDSIIWVTTDEGLRRYNRTNQAWISIEIGDPDQEIILDTTLTTLAFDSTNTVFWVGSDDGLATSKNALPDSWSIDTVNLDPNTFDHNIQSTSGVDGGLSGNFVVAIETQYYDGDRYIWAAGNSTGLSGEQNGLNLSKDNGQTWDIVLTGVSAWNFAFEGPDVYVATSAGLLKTSDFGETWDTLRVIDSQNNTEIRPGTEFYGVAFDNSGDLWAASDDGIASSPDGGNTWTIYRTFQSISPEEGVMTYASPLPSSPFSTPGGVVRFHYRFERSGSVTIKVYDFAMNLVATPVEGVERTGGEQYDNDQWDMKNGNGTYVATGPYFYKVENSSGEEAWGKIMVIP